MVLTNPAKVYSELDGTIYGLYGTWLSATPWYSVHYNCTVHQAELVVQTAVLLIVCIVL